MYPSILGDPEDIPGIPRKLPYTRLPGTPGIYAGCSLATTSARLVLHLARTWFTQEDNPTNGHRRELLVCFANLPSSAVFRYVLTAVACSRPNSVTRFVWLLRIRGGGLGPNRIERAQTRWIRVEAIQHSPPFDAVMHRHRSIGTLFLLAVHASLAD